MYKLRRYPQYTVVLLSAGFCVFFSFYGFAGCFVWFAGFSVVGWYVRWSLRWFCVLDQRLVILDFGLLDGWFGSSQLVCD